MSTNDNLYEEINYYRWWLHICTFMFINPSSNKVFKNIIRLHGKKSAARHLFLLYN